MTNEQLEEAKKHLDGLISDEDARETYKNYEPIFSRVIERLTRDAQPIVRTTMLELAQLIFETGLKRGILQARTPLTFDEALAIARRAALEHDPDYHGEQIHPWVVAAVAKARTM